MNPSPRRFRFRRIGTRLLVLLGGLLALTQAVTYGLVSRANRANALATIEQALAQGARQFQAIADRREEDLLLAARVMAGDYAIRQLFLSETFSPPTVRSALFSYKQRIGAPVIVMLDEFGDFIADTRVGGKSGRHLEPFTALQEIADLAEAYEASGWAYLDEVLHQVVIVPVLAPPPIAVAWIGLGFPVDQVTAAGLKHTANLEVSFITGEESPRVLATTLPTPFAAELARRAAPTHTALVELPLDDQPYLTTYRRLPTTAGEPGWVVLQRSLDVELAPARHLENVLLLTTLASLILATGAALALARSYSRPIRQLAAHTGRIAAGDYATRLDLHRADELGELADAFNHMSAGLDERDRVRDLLDKNVSPAVAAQLLRDGAALGGEEREVTILFADLRGFTTLSETLSPPAVVARLNRYLDRMSAVIEAEGGVIDKFIGDEIMALFGAPLPQADAADRALRAALGMRAALAAFNAELAAEGLPPLAFGVGLNTGRVVAGNIGSHRRLNYSVIGDAVNLAARLQTLTRQAEYATDIIVSAATLAAAVTPPPVRSLGAVTVKGRSGAVEVFAVI